MKYGVWNAIEKYMIYDKDYRRDISLCIRVWKEIIRKKTMR